MKKILFPLLGIICLLNAENAFCYDKDIHFHLTYYLARAVGFEPNIAATIASSAEYVDENPNTEPVKGLTPLAAEQRRLFHFPKHDYVTEPDTQRNSFYGVYNVDKALKDAGSSDSTVKARSVERFGFSLHILADTYAHEGWGYIVGHAKAFHDPDRPYLNQINIDKTKETASLVYSWLVQFYRAYYQSEPSSISISDVQRFIDPLIRKRYAVFDFDYDQQIEDRSANWRQTIASAGYGDAVHSQSDYEKNHLANFLASYQRYCLPHEAPASPARFSSASMSTFSEVQVGVMESPLLFDDYCSYVQQQTGGDINKLVELLIEKPYLANAACVRDQIASREALEKIISYLEEDSSADVVFDLIDKSSAERSVKVSVLRNQLDSKSDKKRILSANLLYAQTRDNQAVEVLKEEYNEAGTSEDRREVLGWMPSTMAFFPQVANSYLSDDSDQEEIATEGLFQIGSDMAMSKLQRKYRRLAMNGKLPRNTAEWILMSYRDSDPTHESSTDDSNMRLLMTVIRKYRNKEYLLKPALAAVRTHYAEENKKTRAEIVRLMMSGLDSGDYGSQWAAAYGIQSVSGQDFQIDPLNPKASKERILSWYSDYFSK